MSDSPAVGFVGLGNIGAAMARRLVDWPGGLIVHDIREAAMAPLVEAGAKPAVDLAELGSQATFVSIVVLDDEQVRRVVAGLLPALPAGAVVAVHSTIRVETAEELASACADRGVHLLDAPISGGAIGAAEGRLAVMVGGQRTAYELAKPIFRRFGDLVVHVGPAGAGTRTKLARNLLTFAGFAAAGEAQRLAKAAGIDLGKLGAVVRHTDTITGGPGAVMVLPSTGPLAADDGLRPIFEHTRALGEKDLDLALDLAQRLDVDVPMARLARETLAAALGVPHDGSDDG